VERATAQGINDVICAGWHLRLRGESDTNTDILVDKSIELSDLLKPGSDLEQEDLSAWSGAPVPSQRGVLSSSTLRSHLAPTGVDARSTAPEPRPEEGAGQEAPARSAPGDGRIRITPIISKKAVGPGRPQSPIQAASYELHLGNWFKVAHRTRYPFVSLAEKEDRLLALREWHSEYYVRRNEDFILHPQDFALACSIEFIALPDNIMALVDGKSGLGRMGLSIATAAQVAPGFHGSLVLELFNVGTLPLKLRPGMAVAQLVFLTTDQPVPDEHLYRGSFRYQLRP
jgi:dCTP deaminase